VVAQVAVALQALGLIRPRTLTRALAGHDLSELGLSHRALQAHEARVVAQRTIRRLDLDRLTGVSVG
jgi:hypothetical protein